MRGEGYVRALQALIFKNTFSRQGHQHYQDTVT